MAENYNQVNLDSFLEGFDVLEEDLLIGDHIPFGEENAISREQLRIRCGMEDRMMRRAIEHDRKIIPIVNTQNGKGYFRPLPEDSGALNAFIKQNVSRALSILQWVKVAKQGV